MVYSTDPHLEQVGPWRGNAPPMRLLQNCHALCMMLSMVGFVLAIVGAMMYVWTMLPFVACIVASVSLGLCLVVGVSVRLCYHEELIWRN